MKIEIIIYYENEALKQNGNYEIFLDIAIFRNNLPNTIIKQKTANNFKNILIKISLETLEEYSNHDNMIENNHKQNNHNQNFFYNL
ncbi:hypothetical protein BpHYR1_031245 [Brachionus plicatilis]|uniref:Uncharacterized protein n=1 Tax=Brachionus plicatilis TaxID=10195 RepID=A0A3M7S0A4_BRAPC|nr:hypothetical protein BpHYR1_031245 [Brachionus plicatilis]